MPLSTQRDAKNLRNPNAGEGGTAAGGRAGGGKRDTRLNVRVSEELLARMHAAAEAEGIPLSSWLKRVVTLALREQERRPPRT